MLGVSVIVSLAASMSSISDQFSSLTPHCRHGQGGVLAALPATALLGRQKGEVLPVAQRRRRHAAGGSDRPDRNPPPCHRRLLPPIEPRCPLRQATSRHS